MPEESTTPDLAELTHRTFEAADRRALDELMSFYAPDAIFETAGMGSFEGVAAIRVFIEEWNGAYDEFEIEAEEIRDLGRGVVIAVFVQNARPTGSTGFVRLRSANVLTWADGLIARSTFYTDIDEARAAAERLAEPRG